MVAVRPVLTRPNRPRFDIDGIEVVHDAAPTPASDAGRIHLSIVVPVLDEARTIRTVIDRLLAVEYPCPVELIVVDDGSTDGTAALLGALDDSRVVVCTHEHNQGKGAAVLTGAARATGTHLLVFDADLEYSPRDIPNLLEPVIGSDCDVVYGTRLFGMNTVYKSFRYAFGNRVMTLTANVLFDACLSDLHTCLKLVPLPLFRELRLSESGFGLDTEITAELLRHGVRPFEVPVRYIGRSRAEGKKIGWRDAVRCFRVLFAVRARRGGTAGRTGGAPRCA